MANAWARAKAAGSSQRAPGAAAGTDIALIAMGGDGPECRRIERKSGNITAILPHAAEPRRAALPHPFAITQLWIVAADGPSTCACASRWVAR